MFRAKLIAFVLGLTFAAAVPAFASDEPVYSYVDGNGFFMRIVDGYGERTGDDLMVFSPDEASKPWLYVSASNPLSFPIWLKKITGTWESVDVENLDGGLKSEWTFGQEAWLKLEGWDQAQDVSGLYEVDATVDYVGLCGWPKDKSGSVYFRVAPEPVSAGLFLLGGLGLLGGRAIRRKKA